MARLTNHAGDCTIYAAMDNGQATDGICICGYGYEQMRVGNWGELYSKEHPRYVDPDDEVEVSWEEFVGNPEGEDDSSR